MTRYLMLGLLPFAAALSACRPTHLVYVYDAQVGLDVAYSTEGSGKLVFGYDRDTYALVPQKPDGEIMALSAVSQVKATGLQALDFNHFVATGDAAEAVALDPEGIRKIRQSIFGDTNEGENGSEEPTE